MPQDAVLKWVDDNGNGDQIAVITLDPTNMTTLQQEQAVNDLCSLEFGLSTITQLDDTDHEAMASAISTAFGPLIYSMIFTYVQRSQKVYVITITPP